jgi:uncharacterized protein YaiI (UPF0178 family)
LNPPSLQARGAPTVFIDADGCPVKDETYRVAQRLQLSVEVVCNRSLAVPSSARVRLVVVGHGSDEADKYIAAQVRPGDVVVTADMPLAARVVDAGAHPITPRGRVYDADSISDALAARDLATTLRSFTMDGAGGGGGPPPFGPKDRSQFLNQLDALLQRALRSPPRSR